MRKAILIAVLVLLLTACNGPFVALSGTQTPTPSGPPQPTLTLTPTLGPVSPPATATLAVTITATAQASTRPELSCKVLQQSFKNGSRFASKELFDISWTVRNTGTATWEPGVVELAYAGGIKMYRYQPVPLTHSSPPGDITTLSADMVAPRTPNKYTMTWALRRGDEYFCKMSVTISVHL
ncbi:MAG: NBR1-Ig-like domain-containing protein [Anaerolineales bacterium]